MNHQTKLTMMMFIAICIQSGLVAVAYRMSHIKPAKLLIFGGPAGFLIGVATGTLMRCALLLLLCLPAYAALPPMPSVPTVKRPAPLLSPKAASAPKSTPMFTPASVPSGTPVIRLFLTTNVVTILNDFVAVEDRHHVQAIQPVGFRVLLQVGDLVTWQTLADFPPDVEDRLVMLTWYTQSWSRAQSLFFRRVLYSESAGKASDRGVVITPLPGMTKVSASTKPLKKGLFGK